MCTCKKHIRATTSSFSYVHIHTYPMPVIRMSGKIHINVQQYTFS